jgi:hypothetical protein
VNATELDERSTRATASMGVDIAASARIAARIAPMASVFAAAPFESALAARRTAKDDTNREPKMRNARPRMPAPTMPANEPRRSPPHGPLRCGHVARRRAMPLPATAAPIARDAESAWPRSANDATAHRRPKTAHRKTKARATAARRRRSIGSVRDRPAAANGRCSAHCYGCRLPAMGDFHAAADCYLVSTVGFREPPAAAPQRSDDSDARSAGYARRADRRPAASSHERRPRGSLRQGLDGPESRSRR